MMSEQEYHVPVLLKESVDGLQIKPDGVYVDVTFGGGGHSREILSRLGKKGVLIAFDQDADALKNVVGDKRLHFVQENFRFFKNHCKLLGFSKVDGILADLGVSSHQFDEPERGFSFRFEAMLDMRMDTQATLTAKEVLNTYPEQELHRIFGQYGEVQNAKTLAHHIAVSRLNKSIENVGDLKEILLPLTPKNKQTQYLAKVFQALRIEVNKELDVLKEFLEQAKDMLNEGGRLSVISYHSLEDRLVKNFMQKGKFSGDLERDFFGNSLSPFVMVSRGAMEPSEEEVERNSRARSAKLRIAEKR